MVHVIDPEADQMLSYIGAEGCHCLGINVVSFARQFVESIREQGDIGKNDEVGQQMIVLEVLAHLPPVVGRDDATIAEGEPFRKAIE